MLHGSLDNISQNTVNTNFDELGDVNMSNVMPIIKIRSAEIDAKPYITTRIIQTDARERVTEMDRQFRQCTKEEFKRLGIEPDDNISNQLCVDDFHKYVLAHRYP